MVHNSTLADRYEQNATHIGMKFESDQEKVTSPSGSTDMGNVSLVVPSIHPMYYIGGIAANHSPKFCTLSGQFKFDRLIMLVSRPHSFILLDAICFCETKLLLRYLPTLMYLILINCVLNSFPIFLFLCGLWHINRCKVVFQKFNQFPEK